MDTNTTLYILLLALTFSIFLYIYTRVQQKRREKLRYEFMMLVAHKLRTPLTQAKWTLSALFDDEHLTDQQNIELTKIKNSNERLIELLDLLLSFSRTDLRKKLTTGNIDLSALIKDIISKEEKHFRNKRIRLKDNIEDGVTVHADQYNLSFLIHTLLSNAVHYTQENGYAEVQVFTKKRKAVLKVINLSDIDMSTSENKKVFSPFFRGTRAEELHSSGLGMSLYVSRLIAKAFKGSLSFTSHTEKDSYQVVFTLTLPLSKKTAQDAKKHHYAQSA